MDFFEALREVVKHGSDEIFVVFKNPHDYEMFTTLAKLEGFQHKDNKIKFYWLSSQQKLVIGDVICA